MPQQTPRPGSRPGTGHSDLPPRWYTDGLRSAAPTNTPATGPYLTGATRPTFDPSNYVWGQPQQPSSGPAATAPAGGTPTSGQIVQWQRQAQQSGANLGTNFGIVTGLAADYVLQNLAPVVIGDYRQDLTAVAEIDRLNRRAEAQGYYSDADQQRLRQLYNSTGGALGSGVRWVESQLRNQAGAPQRYSEQWFNSGGAGGARPPTEQAFKDAQRQRSPFGIPGIPPPGEPGGGRDPRNNSPGGGASPGGQRRGSSSPDAPAPFAPPGKRPNDPGATNSPFGFPGANSPGSQPNPSPYGDSVMGSTPPFLGGQCPIFYIVDVYFKYRYYNNFVNRWVDGDGRVTFDGWGPFADFKPYPTKRNGGWGYHFTYKCHGNDFYTRLPQQVERYQLDHGNPYPVTNFDLTNILIYPGSVAYGRATNVVDSCGNPKPAAPPTPLNRQAPRHRLIIDVDRSSPFSAPPPAAPSSPTPKTTDPDPKTADPLQQRQQQRQQQANPKEADRSGSPQQAQPGGGGPAGDPDRPPSPQPKGSPRGATPTNGTPAGSNPAGGGASSGPKGQGQPDKKPVPDIPKPEIPKPFIPFVGFAPAYPPGTVQWQSWNPDPLPPTVTPPKEITDTTSDPKPKTDPKKQPATPTPPAPTPPEDPTGRCRYTPIYDQQNLALSQKMDVILNIVQTVQLAGIDSKLGPQIPGGLGGFAMKTWSTIRRMYNFLQIDRVLNILTWIGVMHNAFMLSNNIAQTLFAGIDNILNLFGIKGVNDEGQEEEINTGQIISEWTANFFKLIFGAENYTNMVATWKRLNRIYQAAANILYSFQSIGYSILDSMETVGNYVAKIGNAAKEAGVVLERAYSWMNPRNNFTTNRFFRGLNVTQEAVDAFEEISASAVDIKENINQLKGESKKLADELSAGEQTESQQRAESKAKSASPTIAATDLNKPESSNNDS